MLLTGLLSLFQVTILPGVLLLKIFKIRKGILQNIIFTFALSLIANHLIVLLITALGLDITLIFYILFLSELILFFFIYRNAVNINIREIVENAQLSILNYISSFELLHKKTDTFSKNLSRIIIILFMILSSTSIWWAFKVWFNNVDSVFTQWDAVVSWNSWAVDWYSGKFPADTGHYAQLIPTNFAVTYAFLGNTQLQFFAKSFMPLFNLFILLFMLDLGIENKNAGYLIGLVATRYILKKFLGDYISSGYVDVALAFFSFLPFYVLLKAKNTKNQDQQIHYVYLGAIFSAGTALTKQNGLWVLGIYPLLAYFLIVKGLKIQSQKEKWLLLAKALLIALIIILPWYSFNEYRIFSGTNSSNLQYLIGERHEGRNLVERFVRAAGLLEKYAVLFPLILICLPFLDHVFVWAAITIFIPYSLIWALAFSTFPRNLAIAFPYLGLLTGMSAQRIIEFGEKLITRLKVERIKIFFLIIVFALSIVIIGLVVPDSVLITHQQDQQKSALLGYINERLYSYFDKTGTYDPVFTNYPIRYLPEFENLQIDIGNFSDYEDYIRVKQEHPEVKYMLIFEDRANDVVLDEIENNIKNGNYELIFEKGNYLFVKILQEHQ